MDWEKAVLISIRPKWCELIAAGAKTVEVRRNRPALETPFRCYIYCTKPDQRRNTHAGCFVLNDDELYRHPKKGICYGDSIELMAEDDYTADNFLNGKVIGEFICDRIDHFMKIGLGAYAHYRGPGFSDIDYSAIGMTEQELLEYDGRFGWHISGLTVYDRPLTLGDFNGLPKKGVSVLGAREIERAPQSWRYVIRK